MRSSTPRMSLQITIALGVMSLGSPGCGPMYQAPGSSPPPSAPPPAARPAGDGEADLSMAREPTEPPGGPGPAPAARPPDMPARDDRAIPATPPAARPSLPADAQAFLDAHNRVRATHCASPLGWSPKLAQLAQRWANTLRDKGCMFAHSNGSTGENLAAGTTGTLDPEAVVKMWYDEVAHYKFPNGGFSMETGHFTQVVWRGTTQVGCGRSHCKDMDIWVCEYDPAGNWEGQYRENVLPRGCKP